MYVFVLSYYCNKHLYQTIDGLLCYPDLKIVVCENHSENSRDTIEYLRKNYLERGKIEAIVYSKENIALSIVPYAIGKFWNNREHFFFTEQDVLIKQTNWPSIMLNIMRQTNAGIIGNNLDTTNCTEVKWRDFYNQQRLKRHPSLPNVILGASGFQMMLFNKDFYTDWVLNSDSLFSDVKIRDFAQNHKWEHLVMDLNAYHLGWDAWKDFPEYYSRKVAIYQTRPAWTCDTRPDSNKIEIIRA